MEEAKRKTEFTYESRLPLQIHPETLEYGVMITIFNGNQRDTIRYEVSAAWKEKDNLHSLAIIDRITPVYVNDTEPDYIAEELALEVSSTLYPLTLLIDSDGAYSGVHNYPEITGRWSKKKEKIREYYTGEWVEKYLKINDNIFQNKENLEKNLRNDWFLYAFFNRIHCSYPNNLQVMHMDSFPFFQKKKGVDYQVIKIVDECIDEQGYITVKISGTLADERSKADLQNAAGFPSFNDPEKATGSYNGKYILESRYYTIDALILNCSLDLETKKKVSVVVSRIRKGEEEHAMVNIPEKKKGLFSRFNQWLNE
jgi:hypothetical protein